MTHLAMLFVVMGQIHDIPPGLQSAVCYTESHHDVRAINLNDGDANSLGVCQVQLPTARFLGFKGSEAELRQMDTNVRLSGAYLGYLLRRYNGDIRKAVSAYNMGTWRVNAKGQTINRKYVSKVFKAWQENR